MIIRDKQIKTILIFDADGSEDTSVVVVNLCAELARKTGKKELIIDANLRNPSISKILNVEGQGLSEVLEEKVPIEDAIVDVGSGLQLMPAGESNINPHTLFELSFISNVLSWVKDNYDIVIITCSDLKNFRDAVTLSSYVDAIILVINEDKARKQIIRSAIEPLFKENRNVIGAILNNHKYVIPEIIYKLT